MLQRLPEHQKPDLYKLRQGGVWDAYIRVSDVRALFGSMGDKPFVKKPLTSQPYGLSEFEVIDLNGYVLVFSGDDEAAPDTARA